MAALLGLIVLASLAVAGATLLVDLRGMRGRRPRTAVWRTVGAAQAATGLLWLLYGDLALHDGSGPRGLLALVIGALFMLQGIRRVK